MHIVIYILLSIPALVGLFELVRIGAFWVLNLGNRRKLDLVLTLDGSCPKDEIEFALRAAQSRADMVGRSVVRGIIVADNGLSDEGRQICRALCERSDSMSFCSLRDIADYLR